jgi:hypothetical protein
MRFTAAVVGASLLHVGVVGGAFYPAGDKRAVDFRGQTELAAVEPVLVFLEPLEEPAPPPPPIAKTLATKPSHPGRPTFAEKARSVRAPPSVTSAPVEPDVGEARSGRGEEHFFGAPARTVSAQAGMLLGTGGGLPGVQAHGPVLLRGDAICHRYFPYSAHADAGAVTLSVEVSATGDAGTTRVVEEMPAHDGFARAAQTCVQSFRFAPAVGNDGLPLRSVATLRLCFLRRGRHPRT